MKKNIAFTGARGAGKSRISRKFGKIIERTVLSVDTLISYEAGGRSIPRIVREEGWKGFRDREYSILRKICGMENIIIDCGGGILVEAPAEDDPEQKETLSERKVELLKQSCTVVYIKRDPDWLLSKIKNDPNRPDLIGSYLSVLERRLPWYEATADLILDMEELDTDQALRFLKEKFLTP